MVVCAQKHDGRWQRRAKLNLDLAGSGEVEEKQVGFQLLQPLSDVRTGAGPFNSAKYKAPPKFVTKRLLDSDVIVDHKGKHSWFHPYPHSYRW